MPRVLTVTEGNTRSSTIGKDVKIRRSPQAVACRKRYDKNLGSPIGSLKSRREADHYRERERPPDACGVSYQA